MKKLFATIICLLAVLTTTAQEAAGGPFRAYLINKEYNVFLRIDFYQESISVPGQDLYGKLPGYLSKQHNSFCWLITSAEVDGNKATLQMINDYGSEDLTATLTAESDSVYVLKQIDGSTLKVPNNGKWQKLPKTLELKRQ
jgi:hypothetical protein